MSVEFGPGVRHSVAMDEILDNARQLGALERACPVGTAIGVISGKWKPAILRAIHRGHHRYAEIRGDVGEINDQSLTRHLRELVADGVIERAADQSYRLTPQGEGLAGIMEALEDWGEAYLAMREGKQP